MNDKNAMVSAEEARLAIQYAGQQRHEALMERQRAVEALAAERHLRDTYKARLEYLEMRIRKEIPPDPLHGADGRCICQGDGWCLHCCWVRACEDAETERYKVKLAVTFLEDIRDITNMLATLDGGLSRLERVRNTAGAALLGICAVTHAPEPTNT